MFGGNKWRKLKYNLINAREKNCNTLLTFGGAWSNHIYATAAAGKHFGFKTIGFIRGEKHTPLNPTLAFAEQCGMELYYLDRKQYREKNNPSYLKELKHRFSDAYILPEGGSNTLALRGCQEIVDEINLILDTPFDVICCASGTGATLAGLASAIKPKQTAIGFSALKGGDFLNQDVKKFLDKSSATAIHPKQNWQIETRYHFGGYAKVNNQLITFMNDFQQQYSIPLDAIYTAKMFYGLFENIKSGKFKSNSVIIALHSGGLQGNKGFNL